MPELPEVETIVRDLRERIIGQRIAEVRVLDARVVRQMSGEDLCRKLTGAGIEAVTRRSKAVIIALAEGRGFWVVQPMMTGQLVVSGSSGGFSQAKLTIRLSNDQYLHYNDQRLFGRLQWVDDLSRVPYLAQAGLEPFDPAFTDAWLADALKGRRSPIKTLLMDQRFIAGIGNIYASEILFAARVHPRRRADSLGRPDVSRVRRAAVGILEKAIARRGSSMRNYRDGLGQEGMFKRYIKVYAREGQACVRCRSRVERLVMAGRSTFFCPQCQPRKGIR